jgi:hypothetical protein
MGNCGSTRNDENGCRDDKGRGTTSCISMERFERTSRPELEKQEPIQRHVETETTLLSCACSAENALTEKML